MQKLGLALAATLALSAPAQAETLKMATIAPSLGAAISMATFANIVTKNVDGIEIEVAAGGACTLHMMEVGRGNLDMSMTSPVVYNLMSGGKAMYAKQADAPELAKNVNLLMWYPYGAYHFAVRADSDIQTLDDIEGAFSLGLRGAVHSTRPKVGLHPQLVWLQAKIMRRSSKLANWVSSVPRWEN